VPKNLETFTPEFKRDCLAFLLQDQIAAKSVVPHLPMDLFEYDPEYNLIFVAFKEFVDKYNARPNRHELRFILQDACADNKFDEDKQKVLFRAFDNIWEWDQFTAAYVKEKLYDHVAAHHIYGVLRDADDLIDEGDYDELIQRLAAARNTGSEDPEIIEYWSDMHHRVDRRANEKIRRVPTGMVPLDNFISGGLPRGTLGMLMGGSGYGKSALLGQFALQASLAGYNIAYLTLELDADEVMKRNDSSNTGIPVTELPIANVKRVKRKLFDMYKGLVDQGKRPGKYFVQYYPTKTINIAQVENYVKRLRDEKGITLDLLVVDYFDLLKMMGTYTKKYEALEENCEILRGLAGTYDMGIWTASQVNRPGIGKETVDMDDIASGFGKVFPLDLLLTISQTKSEKEAKAFRLHIAKSRLGPANEVVFVEPDFTRMRFKALTADEAKRKKLYAQPKQGKGTAQPQLGTFGKQAP